MPDLGDRRALKLIGTGLAQPKINPVDEHKGFDSYTKEAPEWAKNLELSCSS